MAFLRLCKEDNLLDILRDIFKANIIQVPQASIRPLAIIAQKEQKTKMWGNLKDILVRDFSEEFPESSFFQKEILPDLSGRKSRKVDFNLGTKILTGFLKGFSMPEIGTELKGNYSFQFSFKDVTKISLSPAALGKALIGIQVDKYNPAARVFMGDQAAGLFVIDSVICSNNFSIHITSAEEGKLSLQLDKIQALLSNFKSEIKWNSDSALDIQFLGEQPLTFAFTCLRVVLDAVGNPTLLPSMEDLDDELAGTRGEGPEEEYSYDPVLFHDEPGMLHWDED